MIKYGRFEIGKRNSNGTLKSRAIAATIVDFRWENAIDFHSNLITKMRLTEEKFGLDHVNFTTTKHKILLSTKRYKFLFVRLFYFVEHLSAIFGIFTTLCT